MSYGILIEMAANVARLQSDMQKAAGSVKQFADQAGKAVSGVDSLLQKVGVTLSVGLVAGFFFNITKNALATADAVTELGERVGVSAEFLQQYKLAAETSGSSLEGLANGMKFLNKNIVEAAAGSKDQAEAFRMLGIAARNSDGSVRSAEEVFADLVDAFSSSEAGSVKVATALKLLGREGASMIPILNLGKEGLEDMRKTSEALGLVMDKQTLNAAARMNDTIHILGQTSQGLGNRIVREVMPTLEGLASWLLKAAKDGEFFDTVARGVAVALKLLVSAGTVVVQVFRGLGAIIASVSFALTQVLDGKFRDATETLKFGFAEVGSIAKDTGDKLRQLWTDDMPKLGDSAIAVSRSMRQLNVVNEQSTKEAEKHGDAVKKLLERFDELRAANEAQLAQGRKLTDAEKEYVKALDDHTRGVLVLTPAELKLLAVKAEAAMVAEKNRVNQEEWTKAQEEFAKSREDMFKQMGSENEKLAEAVLRRQNEAQEIGLTRKQIHALKQARIDEAIAHVEAAMSTVEVDERELALLAQRLKLLNELKAANDEVNKKQNDGTWGSGFKEAWSKFREGAENDAAHAGKVFNTVVGGMEEAWVNFVRTGKFSMRDLTDAIIADLARIAFQKMIVAMVSQIGLSGFAEGGSVMSNRAVVVGERGPELFVPHTSGTVVPSHKANVSSSPSVNVVQNINVDSRSDRASVMVAMEEARKRAVMSVSEAMSRRSPQFEQR